MSHKGARRAAGRFLNSDPAVEIGNFPWYEMVWRGVRGDFKPAGPPAGGYAAFADTWSVPVDFERLHTRSVEPVVTWLGHVTTLLQINGVNILLDPTLCSHAGPRGQVGARRRVPPPLSAGELPDIDWVLVSHNHYDHLDYATLMQLHLAGQRPHYLVPLGVKAWFDARGIDNVTEMDWWQTLEAERLRFHFTPAQHWSRRTPFDTNQSLWGGFCVEWQRPGAADWRFLFPGDTGYSADFRTIRQRLGRMDFVALPIGAYEPRDFMKPMHVNPAEAVQIFIDLGASHAMAVHWGTFELTQERFDQPPVDLRSALQTLAGAPSEDAIWLMKHGETRAIPLDRG